MKSILITGCSSGIGYFCAKTLQTLGYNVIASCRKAEDVERLNAEGVKCIHLDLACRNSIECGFEKALTLCNGQLDVLFNNGAFGQPGAVEDLDVDVLKYQFEINFFSWHHLTNLAIKHMRNQGQGRIINNSSVLGFVALPYRGAYNASKFALEGLTDTLRMELANTNIFISLIEPGPIQSNFRENAKNAFKKNIDIAHSKHLKNYKAQLNRLTSQTSPQKFTLGPEAVLDKLLHAMNAKQPKPRYYVTIPTYFMGIMRRLLSSNWLDKILIKSQ